ncbi:hypothetical protein [Lysinibacillus capsici]|uniref:hypothetical protein n=1 Tax=Lysinibacillus capsici TaxID=2115968 RepID=UPI003D750662
MLPAICCRKGSETGRWRSKTAIKINGSMGEVTVSFDDKKTDIQAIKTAVSDFGLEVE